MPASSLFWRPVLIYDDKCYSCTKFAKTVSALSKGWIRIAGHYYSQEAKDVRAMIFPPDYDATKMFWLVNRTGAYGARSGLLPLAKEITRGILFFKGQASEAKGNRKEDQDRHYYYYYYHLNDRYRNNSSGSGSNNNNNYPDHYRSDLTCEYSSKDSENNNGAYVQSCYAPNNTFKRLVNMLSHGAKFTFY